MTPKYHPQVRIDRTQDTADGWPALARCLKGLGPALRLTLPAFCTLSIERGLQTLCVLGLLQG